MALIKEPYGLVYNDDGSLCTTYRDDDIPFQGVKSFAVETATTNLVTNSPQQPPCIKQQNAVFTRSIVTSGSLAGWVKIHITNIGGNQSLIHFGLYSHPANETRTYAIDAILPDSNDICLKVTGRHGWGVLQKISNTRYAETVTPNSDGNLGIYIQSKVPANTTGSWDVYVRNYQIEQKPFATSFVDGSRPAPALQFRPLPRETVNIGGTDWQVFTNTVISFWFKVPRVQDADLNTTDSYPGARQYAILTNYPTHIYDWNWGQFTLGIQRNTGHLLFRNLLYSVSHVINIALRGEYEDEWHMFVLCKWFENNTFFMKCFYDGEIVYDSVAVLRDTSLSQTHDNIYFYNYYKRSNLISNFFIGKYRKPDGTVIWTDEYIQEM